MNNTLDRDISELCSIWNHATSPSELRTDHQHHRNNQLAHAADAQMKDQRHRWRELFNGMRVRKYEAEGMTRSDAQSVVDCEDLHPELWEPKEINNDDRANFVQNALNRYQQARHATESGDDLEEIVIDFLTDLMHLADRDGLDLPTLQRIAMDYYLEEKQS